MGSIEPQSLDLVLSASADPLLSFHGLITVITLSWNRWKRRRASRHRQVLEASP